jgi:hypothetical protein
MAKTLGDIYRDEPAVTVPPSDRWTEAAPAQVWANYDRETDSFIAYFTGGPVRGAYIWLKDDTYVIVEPSSGRVGGVYVEGWERRFVPAHAELRAAWPPVKESLAPETGSSHLLRMVAVWLYLLLQTGASPALRPA